MKGVRRIPVMDEPGWRAGIISWDDLLAYLAEQIGGLSRFLFRGLGARKEINSPHSGPEY
jgi:hypothetical protein